MTVDDETILRVMADPGKRYDPPLARLVRGAITEEEYEAEVAAKWALEKKRREAIRQKRP